MAGLPVDISAFTAKYAAMAVEHNLPFVAQQRVYNTRNAHELSHWALEQGKIDTWHRAVFDAYYGQARNIADPMVLADIAEAIGLPAQQALAALEEKRYAGKVDRDWATVKRRDIIAAPTYMIADARLVGAQPYEKLQHFIETGGAEPR
jgi:predicted DsbA family dithiol-disulfide isomerase